MRNGDLYFVTGRHTHVDTAVIVRNSHTAAIKKEKKRKKTKEMERKKRKGKRTGELFAYRSTAQCRTTDGTRFWTSTAPII